MNTTKGLAATAVLVPGLYSSFLPADLMDRERDPFIYGLFFSNLAAASTASETFTVQSDSDFLITALTGIVVENGTPGTRIAFPPLLVRIEDSVSGRNLESRAVHYGSLFGDAELPGIMTYPKLVKRAAAVTVTLENLAAATAYDVRLAFHGFKIFDWQRARR